jgi:probable HAF family extracellular repeat protein
MSFYRALSPGLIAVVLLAVAFPLTARTSAAAQYTVTDLGSFIPTGINISGQVCGNLAASAGQGWTTHAAVYSNGSIQDLGVIPNYASSFANDINTSGQVVGYDTVNGYSAAFEYENGTMLNLKNLSVNVIATSANGINSAGEVVGNAAFINNPDSDSLGGFLYANGEIQGSPLNVSYYPTGYITGNSYAINDSGDIAGVGYDYPDSLAACAAVYSNGNIQPFGTSITVATAINSSGHAIGQTYQNVPPSSFLFVNGSVTPLTLSASQYADALNDEDQVVGTIGSDAALFDDGTTTDLNTLIPGNSGWALENATAINDLGQIVGIGTNPNGQTDGFLLTPSVPEPGSMAASILVLACLLKRQPSYLRDGLSC